MKLTSVTVNYGETVPKKIEKFSNWKLDVSLTAQLEEGDNALVIREELMQQAQTMVAAEKQRLLTLEPRLPEIAIVEDELNEMRRSITEYKKSSQSYSIMTKRIEVAEDHLKALKQIQ